MQILITTHYFYPENFPVINDLAITLKNQGNEVTIGTGKPNYAGGKIYKNYKLFSFEKENFDSDIKVFRTPVFPRQNNKVSLFFNYISYIITGSILFPFYLRNKKFDFIIHYGAGPVSSIIPSIILRFQKKAHLVFWVQDLWPDTLKSYFFTKNKIIQNLIKILVKYIYFNSDTILVQSKSFIEPVSKYAKKDKIFYFPNILIDFNKNTIVSKDNKINSELKKTLENYKCIVFAGNLGEAQSLETIIKAAICIKKYKNCKIVFIGSGIKLNWLKTQINVKKLNNVFIGGAYPSHEMNNIYNLATGLLVTLKDKDVFNKTIPSKVQSYLAAGKPILAALSGEGGRIIKESGAGLVCKSEDYLSLSKNIKLLLNMKKKTTKKLGEYGRKYYLDNYEMKKKSKELISIINHEIEMKNK